MPIIYKPKIKISKKQNKIISLKIKQSNSDFGHDPINQIIYKIYMKKFLSVLESQILFLSIISFVLKMAGLLQTWRITRFFYLTGFVQGFRSLGYYRRLDRFSFSRHFSIYNIIALVFFSLILKIIPQNKYTSPYTELRHNNMLVVRVDPTFNPG